MGSLVYVGGLALEDAYTIRGIDGATVGEELRRIGYQGEGRVWLLNRRLPNPTGRPPMVAFYSALSGDSRVGGSLVCNGRFAAAIARYPSTAGSRLR